MPLFMNINDNQPISLFGGDSLSAVINEEGRIIFLSESLFNSPKKAVESIFLPEKENAVFVGFFLAKMVKFLCQTLK